MDIGRAKDYIVHHARPLDLCLYRYFFDHGSKEDVLDELRKFQNFDGGFGNALELDNWNPNSNPIATNDALKILISIDALNEVKDIREGMMRYLLSHDSFDEDKNKWLFAIESNRNYPHAIWWEKKGDGISDFNPTVSLSTLIVCFNEGDNSYYKEIIREAFTYVKEVEEIGADSLKCFLISYDLLEKHKVTDVIDLSKTKELLINKIEKEICKDVSKYGFEYVPVPSDFFVDSNFQFLNESITKLAFQEVDVLGKLQKEDGGFDITWKWQTPYAEEFEQARTWWRARITIDKMLFERMFVKEKN